MMQQQLEQSSVQGQQQGNRKVAYWSPRGNNASLGSVHTKEHT